MSLSKNRVGRIVLILMIVLVNIGCDQQTKIIAEQRLEYREVTPYMNDFFRLILVENKGAFLSFGSDLHAPMSLIFLKIFPSLVLLGLGAFLLFSRGLSMGQPIAFSYVLGGGISNIYDRIFNDGAVVDFMNFGIGNLRTGIFNFADVSIMIGLFVLLFTYFQKPDS